MIVQNIEDIEIVMIRIVETNIAVIENVLVTMTREEVRTSDLMNLKLRHSKFPGHRRLLHGMKI
jgi:hypothetical protein